MSELNFTKLADAPVLEEVPDGAKVYVEVDGKVYREAGDNLGGSGVAIAEIDMDDLPSQTSLADLKERASATIYTGTCKNMTFAEAFAILEARKPLLISGHMTLEGMKTYSIMQPIATENNGVKGIVFECAVFGYFYWYSDGMITTDSNYGNTEE